jgi:hypothetical protein
MRRIKNISAIFTMLLLFACIKPYNPVIDTNSENKYVVSGQVTSLEGWQVVDVSMSSPVGSPRYIPVEGCQVKILNDKGNEFPLQESAPGKYQVWMVHEDLIPGTSYQVKVTTPGGEELASGFDKMPDGPPQDSVYYSLNDVPVNNSTTQMKVIQFYIDLNAVGNYSQYYKWDIIETWEYHAAQPAHFYYDGTIREIIPPDSSNMVCWATEMVKNVYTVSTKSLTQNVYKQFPLHSFDINGTRLGILYSMLVRQLALSEQAYNYWEQLRINSNEQGGLYEKQPLAIKGNMLNMTNPEKSVLGFFYAASESTRRYFYRDIEGVSHVIPTSCYEEGLGRFGWKEFFTWEYPIYFYFNAGVVKVLTRECVDCRKLGGTIVKPDFWPN